MKIDENEIPQTTVPPQQVTPDNAVDKAMS